MNLDWIGANLAHIAALLGSHVWLTIVPTLLGLVIAIPLGWWAHRAPRLGVGIVGAAGLLYTIPSLALFVLLPALLGTRILDPLNVVIALTVYTVALLVRTVVDGLASVPHEARQAAEAMGYRAWQRLALVELPVATPVIIGGLRVAVVSNVSITTMAALVGIPQLGTLFTQGFQLRMLEPLLAGILLCVGLAVALDALLVLAARLTTPWRRRAVSS